MAGKFQNITELYESTAKAVTATPSSWRAFLASACRNYRLPFDEQLLIYAQRPDATAVLELDRWNQRFGRWVNRGAKGIAVFDREHPNRLRYYFDVADTHETRMSRPVPLWQVSSEYEQDVVETLENSFGELEHREDLGDALLSAVRNAVEDNMGDYLGELEQLTQDSLLEGLDSDNLTLQFRTVLGNSVAAMLLARCGIDTASYLEDEDFQDVGNFNTPETRNALGVATRDIARMCLDEIARTVLSLERQGQKENRTLADSPTNLYAETREPETPPERSPHDGSDLHHAGELPASQSAAVPGEANAPGQVRPDAEALFAGAPENHLHQPVDQREAFQPSGRNSADGTAPDRGNRSADGESSGRDGGTESQRPDEMGADDEQPAERSGGNGAGGTDLQLTQGPQQLSLFPSEQEQIRRIDQVESEQTLSAFSVSQESIDHVLRLGGNTDRNRERVAVLYEEQKPLAEIVASLPSLYHGGDGIGSVTAWYDQDGIHLSQGQSARYDSAQVIPWQTAAERIGQLLENGQFATNVELAEAGSYERSLLADRFWYLYHDLSVEAMEAGYLQSLSSIQGNGFPEESAWLTQQLADPAFRAALLDEYQQFLTAHQENRGLLRFHYHRLEEMLRNLRDLDLPRKTFSTGMPEVPEVRQFITEDEIDAALAAGPYMAGGKGRIYAFFQGNHTSQEKAGFLKQEYGIGGRSHALSGNGKSWENSDGQGLVYRKENCLDVRLSWTHVARHIDHLVEQGRYLSPQELDEWEKDQAEKELAQADEIASANTEEHAPSKVYDLGYGHLGNGVTVWNRLEEEHGDYKTVAHIAPDRTVQIYDEEMPQAVREEIQRIAGTSEMTVSATQNAPVFAVPPKVQEPPRKEEVAEGSYQLLSRLKADCDYFLGAGGRAEKHLWAGNVREQIAKMRELYDALPEKPEWLTMEDIDRYAQRMEPFYEVVVYHHFENGFDERMDYQTLDEAERVAQKYVAGTMEGEDGFAYDGAGVYDLQENRWLRVYGNFPDERAIAEASRVLPDDRQEKTGPVQMSIEDPAPYEDLVGKELTIDGHRFVVERVSDLTGDVALRDVTFEESHGFPLDRMEKIDQVRQLIVEQEEPVKQRSTVIDLTAPVREEEASTQKEELPTPPSARRARVSPTVLHPEIPPEQRRNFRITDGHLGEGGAKTKFHNNVAAIQTLRKIESEGRLATPEEQEILSRYVGWGGLPQVFDGENPQWAEEFAALKGLLSPEEYDAAKATTLNAHYTSPTVIKAIYQAVENMGFRTGNILEPSCGIGNFFGLVPESMKDSHLYGVELDPLTGRIAQQLYQQNSIAVQGFENTELPDSFFDLAIGNVPFGSYSLHDKRYDKHHFLIHDYFFAKTLDKVRPGGIVAFITSKGTMDKQNPSVRKYLAERAQLIGAIRLPNNAFLANAGTRVTTDILFLQKREKLVDVSMPAPDSGLEWLHLVQTEDGVPINQYFLEHPEMMLGQMAFDRSMYGNAKETTCKPLEGESLSDLLAKAVGNLHAQYTPYEIEEREDEEDRSIPADPTVRNFSYTVVDGVIYYREDSRMFPVEVSVTAENRIRGMIALRDCARSLIEVQMEDGSEEAVQAGQQELNRLYDSFTAQYGLLNSRANTSVFSSDSSFPLLCSLEILDEQGNLKRKADLFSKRTIQPYRAVTHVDTASEALAVSLGEKARVDLEYMGSLTGKTQEQLTEELRGVIFPVPSEVEADGKPHYVTADEYLSGNVREKLKTARQAAEQNPSFAVNVQALEKVQPKDLTAGEISVRLGATWIPEDVAEQFTHELLQTPFYYKSRIRVRYSTVTGEWNVSEKSLDRSNIRVFNTYGTKRVSAYKIVEDTLNLRDVRVFDTVQDENGKDQRVLNKKETAIAQDKQDQIKEKFQEWVWSDPARRERLCSLYNEKFNAIRPREYDGSHLVFAGMNPEITLRPHQRNAVARAIYGGNALFAHVVGAGKTYEMIAAAMESKRLGLSSKALFVVPNHIIGDFASDFLDLYPGANILVATKKDFEKQCRKKFCARIATGDYDGIILGHSQFEKIPLSPERQQAMLKKQIAEVVAGIQAAKKQEGARFTIKQMEKSKKSLEAKLKKLHDQSAKDDVVTFEELGIDRLFMDEADLFKNLYLYTKMRNVGGISQTESLKASDLYMKCQYMDELTGGKGVVFATGTPVSNSMAVRP